VKNDNHGFGKLAGFNLQKCLQSHVVEVSEQKELIFACWCKAKFHDFCVLALFCDLVVCGVKNENYGFGKLVGLNPHKTGWTQSSQNWLDSILTKLVGKRKLWFWKTVWENFGSKRN